MKQQQIEKQPAMTQIEEEEEEKKRRNSDFHR